MIITTTDNIRYYEIGEYLDVVSAMSMYAASTKISSSTISQDELYETCFEKTKQKIVKQALKIQADAIVGLTVEYLSKDDTSDMVLSLTGTAVRFKQTKEWTKTQKERPEFEKEIQPALADGGVDLEMDCSELNYMASSGLRIIQKTMRTVMQQRGQFKMTNVNAEIYKVLAMTGFTKFMKVEKKAE